MKTDRYTKIVLTVIAACLVINILEKIDIIPKAYANSSDNFIAPINSNYAVVPVNEDGSINVTVKSAAPMDVNLVKISTNDDLDVNVNVEKIGGRYVYGEIPVTVKQ
ncbi:hypothetical protein E0W68_00055 [Flavobacterium salilacus subsp. salilacus]|uniref:hypothetical protein n=1 Tax=Flavobacterium TaxID=237 RepID=UPI001074A98B|nr:MULTISPECIES: hypothetical protein [Flavobacterium]KAF2519671.1 hypothetical protein E0W68_00055 [Flavobacterium salilacus subsp. salilacus]MBE1614442.1 hypothetical protein [Flavobacterium sp. SaA2.13]